MSRSKTFLLATSALLSLGIGPSLAGPCAEQIAQLEKAVAGGMNMASSNAVQGSGQGPGGSAAQTSATPPVAATPSQAPKAGQAPDTGATVAMNRATENIATSPQDVRAQQQGQPTASQTAQAASGQGSPSPATTGSTAPGASGASGGAYQTATGVLQQQGATGTAQGGTAGPSATPSQAPKAGQAPDTGATVAMNKATENIATSAQDVRAQQQGQPTASQTAQAASGQGGASSQAGASPGATGDQVNKDRVNQAMAALNRAKELDSQGKDTECTNAVMEARRIYGQQ